MHVHQRVLPLLLTGASGASRTSRCCLSASSFAYTHPGFCRTIFIGSLPQIRVAIRSRFIAIDQRIPAQQQTLVIHSVRCPISNNFMSISATCSFGPGSLPNLPLAADPFESEAYGRLRYAVGVAAPLLPGGVASSIPGTIHSRCCRFWCFQGP
jgi:hypothetical protein